MTGCLDDIEAFSWLDKALIDLLLASAKDPAASTKNIWRKACTWDWITEGERAQDRADNVALALNVIQKNSVAEIDEGIFARLSSIHCPTLNTHADVAHEKVFEINATPPRVISLNVTVIDPISSRENVRAPKRNV